MLRIKTPHGGGQKNKINTTANNYEKEDFAALMPQLQPILTTNTNIIPVPKGRIQPACKLKYTKLPSLPAEIPSSSSPSIAMPQEPATSPPTLKTMTRISGLIPIYLSRDVTVLQAPTPVEIPSSYKAVGPAACKSSGYEVNNSTTNSLFFTEAEINNYLQTGTTNTRIVGMKNEERVADSNHAIPLTSISLSSSLFSSIIHGTSSQAIASTNSSGFVKNNRNNSNNHPSSISRNYSSISSKDAENNKNSTIIGCVYLSNEMVQQVFSTLQRNISGCFLYYGSENIVEYALSDSDDQSIHLFIL